MRRPNAPLKRNRPTRARKKSASPKTTPVARARKKSAPRKPKGDPRLTTAQLAIELGVKARQVRRWIESGLPSLRVARATGGRPIHTFDLIETKSWLIAHSIVPRGAVAPPGSTPPGPVPAIAREAGYTGMHARLEIAERDAFAMWATAVENKDTPVTIALLAKEWRHHAEHLRKVAKDLAAIRSHQAAWVERTAVVATFENMATEIKGALLAIPQSLAPRLETRTAHECQSILEAAVQAILGRLANGGPSTP